MNVTAQSLCTRALRTLGIVGQGETPDPDELVDAYAALNEMIDAWAIERLTVVVVERAEFPLTANVQTYTIGAGGTFNRQRPVFLEGVSIVQNPLIVAQRAEYRCEPVHTADEWARLIIKGTATDLPRRFYYDHAYPLGSISYYPMPSVSTIKTILQCPTALSQFATLTTTYDMPPGYARAIRYNLAHEIAAEYGLDPNAFEEKAEKTMGRIKSANSRAPLLRADHALLQSGTNDFDYRIGE